MERTAAAAAPSLLRRMNQRLLLDRLFAHGPATRPRLARETGLSLPTVIAALRDLEHAGLVRPAGRHEPEHGRPAAAYEANPAAGRVLGVDIGREKLRVLVTDLAGDPLGPPLEVRNRARTADALVDQVDSVVAQATLQVGIGAADVTHTVVGSPGVFSAAQSTIRYAPNLPGWQRPGLAETLADRLGAALTIDNDANLAALGEHAYGAALGLRNFVYLQLGTGVGLGLVLGGQLYRGRGAAGEIGFLPLGDCRSTNARRGMLEESVAADGIVRRAEEEGMTGRLTAERIFAAARAGDEPALRTVGGVGGYIGSLVAGILAFLDPELIVFGGGIGQNLDLLEPHVTDALAAITPLRPQLAVSALGAEAVLRGAIATGVTAARESVFAACAKE
ncbi:ROK family transcriptional regulator [Actinospica sp.]|uniref:ROK family transcriptional regulator n=1 Tax=Actinospica sp. TaxID=1872142 RepID=UPI002CD208B3|nr:ROK family transcriptional regulator [Actinospica sp.]HWG23908.1 ROK family transcriptional regulator [Actinospica sp.]